MMIEELLQACVEGDTRKLEQLINAHPELNLNALKHDEWSSAPLSLLQFAIWNPLLAEASTTPDSQQRTTPSLDLAIIEMLSKHPRIDINSAALDKRLTALYMMIISRHLRATQILLAQPGIDLNIPDNEGITPLHRAIKLGENNIALRLIRHPRTDVNQCDHQGNSPLQIAAHSGNPTIARRLLEKKEIKINTCEKTYGISPLTVATLGGHVEFVGELLNDERTDLNILSFIKISPLYYAAVQLHPNFQLIFDLFLQNKKTDFNIKERRQGNTLLHILIALDQTEVALKIIKDDRTDINAINKFEVTPLMLALEKRNTPIAVALLRHPKIQLPSKKSTEFANLLKMAKKVQPYCVHLLKTHHKPDHPSANPRARAKIS